MPPRSPFRSLFAPLALAIVVAVLGSLQYRWIEQLSEAERLRLKSHLRTSSVRRAEKLAGLQMEFAAGVSHELRTAPAVIQLVADNLACGVTASAAQVSEAGAVILRDSRRLSSLVKHALRFTALRAGRKPLAAEPVDAGETVRQALEQAAPLISEAGFRVETHFDSPLPPVWADQEALGHCVRNLISNALKSGGEARYIAIRVEGDHGVRGAAVRISVSDRGPGIPRGEVPHIFEPFSQGVSNGGVKSRGVGLGLSLTRELIEEIGGRVVVETGPGGSRFTLHVRPVQGNSHAETNPACRG